MQMQDEQLVNQQPETQEENPKPEKEKMVAQFNTMISENKELFYAVYDQASLTVNPDKPTCSKLEYLGGDKLHPNLVGGRLVADNINLDLFKSDN